MRILLLKFFFDTVVIHFLPATLKTLKKRFFLSCDIFSILLDPLSYQLSFFLAGTQHSQLYDSNYSAQMLRLMVVYFKFSFLDRYWYYNVFIYCCHHPPHLKLVLLLILQFSWCSCYLPFWFQSLIHWR